MWLTNIQTKHVMKHGMWHTDLLGVSIIYIDIFSGDGWDANDAKVVCRELGFNPEYEFSKATFSSNFMTKHVIKYLGIGRIVSAKCNGEEKQLADCVSPSENCHGGLAKIICHGKIDR